MNTQLCHREERRDVAIQLDDRPGEAGLARAMR